RISADGTGLVAALGAPADSFELREIEPSPDGRFVTFEVVDGQDFSLRDLYLASTTDAGFRKLLDRADELAFLGYTPDGSLAFYQRQSPEYSSPLMAVPTAGAAPFPLTPSDFGDVQEGLVFGPAGNTMSFRVKRHEERIELHALELDGILIFTDGFESGDFSAWSGVVQ
ncbi:MAG: hypothetical protein AAGM22_27075, partial [Acidobacteriota bacterium]